MAVLLSGRTPSWAICQQTWKGVGRCMMDCEGIILMNSISRKVLSKSRCSRNIYQRNGLFQSPHSFHNPPLSQSCYLFFGYVVLKSRLIKMYSAKSSFFRPALGCLLPPFSPCHPLLPTVSFGSSLGNDNFPVYHLSSLSYVKLQNDISFLLISPKGKQCITQEFCVKS